MLKARPLPSISECALCVEPCIDHRVQICNPYQESIIITVLVLLSITTHDASSLAAACCSANCNITAHRTESLKSKLSCQKVAIPDPTGHQSSRRNSGASRRPSQNSTRNLLFLLGQILFNDCGDIRQSKFQSVPDLRYDDEIILFLALYATYEHPFSTTSVP